MSKLRMIVAGGIIATTMLIAPITQIGEDYSSPIISKSDTFKKVHEMSDKAKVEEEKRVQAQRQKELEEAKKKAIEAEKVESKVVAKSVSKPKVRQVTASRSSRGREITVVATAYTADCHGCSGVTATGIDVRSSTPRIIAVDPSVIPLGSRVEIDGVIYMAEDTGGAIKSNRIDILMSSESKALNFGRQKKTIRILD